MKIDLFIAKRLIRERKSGATFSRPINVIAITGIALGLAVMILAVAILTGFKQSIRDKVAGFGAHIQVTNFDSNMSYETIPISSNQEFVSKIKRDPGISNVQVYGLKAGIIKTADNMQGVVLKGVGSDYDWSFFESNMVEGEVFRPSDTASTNKVVISRKVATMLNLKLGDSFSMFFIQEPPRMRKFKICGIYETSLEEFDKTYCFCDISHIRKLNGWSNDKISGFEIFIKDFDRLEEMTDVVRDAIGYRISEKEETLKVTNIKSLYPQIFDWLGFQDLNVIVILTLMILVAGFNMISGLLILILEKTNMIGILKALGSGNRMIRQIFLYQASWLIAKGLLWGNLIGIGLALFQLKTNFIPLDPTSYYLRSVPINLDPVNIILLNIGTMIAILGMLLIPSQIIARITPVKAIRYD
ncbi:MAG TPA: ABC transporter permease [Bacteroidales bacterium]|nr:ABC transporter permease [Bacteroidales bacterium]HPT11825.1 ABC transporter permease [Bacteroidales bacterium]